jgi:membrane protease YdiL (CAAX protease family)
MELSWKQSASWIGVLVAVGALAVLALRVYEHERAELEFASEPRTLGELAGAPGSTAVSARVARVELERGEHAVFELCAADRLEPARWQGAVELVVFQLPAMKLMLRVPLDAEHLAVVKRNAESACLTLGGGAIEQSGSYSVDAVWPRGKPGTELLQVPVQARVLGTRPLQAPEKSAWLALGLAVIAVLSLQLGTRANPDSETDSDSDSRRLRVPALLAAAGTLAALVVLTQVPTAGALATLAKGLSLIGLQCAVPLVLARVWRRGLLPLAPRIRPPAAFGLALASAFLLWGLARLSLQLVPATGEAPIQAFVNWPSGLLCFAGLGVLLPLGEELLFRGLLFRSLLVWTGRVGAAALLSWLPFVALHAQQSWGNWGGLVSIALAGVVLTALRVATGSVLVPALAHVLYNFALSAGAFW